MHASLALRAQKFKNSSEISALCTLRVFEPIRSQSSISTPPLRFVQKNRQSSSELTLLSPRDRVCLPASCTGGTTDLVGSFDCSSHRSHSQSTTCTPPWCFCTKNSQNISTLYLLDIQTLSPLSQYNRRLAQAAGFL